MIKSQGAHPTQSLSPSHPTNADKYITHPVASTQAMSPDFTRPDGIPDAPHGDQSKIFAGLCTKKMAFGEICRIFAQSSGLCASRQDPRRRFRQCGNPASAVCGPEERSKEAVVPEARLELACREATDFESAASTIPPLGPARFLAAARGFYKHAKDPDALDFPPARPHKRAIPAGPATRAGIFC